MKKLSLAFLFSLMLVSFALANVPVSSDMAPVVGPVADYAQYTLENPCDNVIWTTGANLPQALYGPACAYYNGLLFEACGRIGNAAPINTAATRSYDPASNTWTNLAAAPTAVRMMAAGMMQDGQYLYVVGGRNESSSTVGLNQRYNMATNTWETLAPCTPRWAHGGAVTGGFVYVFGGSDATVNTTVQKYDPAVNAWTNVAPLPAGRGWTCGASLNGKVYCIGGSAANTLYEYDPALNTWTTKAPMPSTKTYCWAAGDQSLNKIFVFGGTPSATPTADVWVWDAATNTWSTETAMPGPRNWPGVGNNGTGTFYVLGGFDGNTVYYNNTWVGSAIPPQVNLNVTLTPTGSTVIPAQGGNLLFDVAVVNNGPVQGTFTGWARIKNPNGTYTDPTLGPIAISPAVGQTVSRSRVQTIPGTWPSGAYQYIAYVNMNFAYPAIDSASFNWTKSADMGNGPWVTELSNYGEPFPGEVMNVPTTHAVLSAYPNPFNPATTISFSLPEAQRVTLNVYDMNGRLVSTLVNGYRAAGNHSITFDGSDLASGVYLYSLTANGHTATAKMVLMK